jgi:hypothetical protein
LYRTAAENISLAQIQSQIDIFKDFNATNSDFNQVPALFAGVKKCWNYICISRGYRKSTTRTSWGTTDDMKEHLLEESILLHLLQHLTYGFVQLRWHLRICAVSRRRLFN